MPKVAIPGKPRCACGSHSVTNVPEQTPYGIIMRSKCGACLKAYYHVDRIANVIPIRRHRVCIHCGEPLDIYTETCSMCGSSRRKTMIDIVPVTKLREPHH